MVNDKDFKIKLIFLRRRTPLYFIPYGLGILAASLRERDYYVEQENLTVRFDLLFRKKLWDMSLVKDVRGFFQSGESGQRLIQFIDKILSSTSLKGFHLIGLSAMTFYQFLTALIISYRIKQITNAPVVFGGAFINLYGYLYPGALDVIDYMIAGDGRVPLLKLIDYLKDKIPLSEVPNLIYKKNGDIAITTRTCYPLEDIPIPDFIEQNLKVYSRSHPLPYQITRGCTNSCSFCVNNNVMRSVEFKSYDKVLSELGQMKERYKSNVFLFCDDAINNSYEYLEGLCGLFIKNRLDIYWGVYAKIGNLDKYILRKMKQAGCCYLTFGIESGSDRMLSIINKGFTAEQAVETLRYSYEAGIKNIICLIVGFPHEAPEDMLETAKFIRKNKKFIYHISCYKFMLKHGSPMYLNPQRYGIDNVKRIYKYKYKSFCCAFDECDGLKWKQKVEQQKERQRKIKNIIRWNLSHKKYKAVIFYFLGINFVLSKLKEALRILKIYKT